MTRQLRQRWDFWTAGIIRPVRVVIVAVILLVLPAIGIVRDVMLQPEDRNWGLLKYMPRVGWYWYVIAIIVCLLVLIEETSVRAHRIGLRDQRLKHIDRFSRYRERNKRPIVIVQGTPDPTNLVSSTHERRVYRDERGVIFERDGGEEAGADFYAVTVDFNNAILEKRKSGEAMDVSARVNFHPFDTETNEYVTLDRGAWLRETSGKVTFGRNDTRELVIATSENNCIYAIKQLTGVNDQKVTTKVPLPNDSFDVHVRLNAELENRSIKRTHLILERTMERKAGIKLTPAYLWRSDRLREFYIAGLELARDAILLDTKPIENREVGADAEAHISAEFVDWQEQVAGFLTKRWDNQHKQKFLPDPPKRKESPAWARRAFPPAPAKPLYDQINAKMEILDAFRTELMQEPLKEIGLR